jgi:hypothetical protein
LTFTPSGIEVDDVQHIAEECHVFSNQESEVTTFNLRVVHDGVSDGVASPVYICLVSQLVTLSTEECNWNFSNSLDGDQVSVSILTNWDDLVVRVRILLESVFSHVLGIVKNTLSGGTVGLVVHVHLKSVFIIVHRVSIRDHLLDERAEEVKDCASKASGPVGDEIALSESVNSKYACGIVKLVVENGSPLESF